MHAAAAERKALLKRIPHLLLGKPLLAAPVNCDGNLLALFGGRGILELFQRGRGGAEVARVTKGLKPIDLFCNILDPNSKDEGCIRLRLAPPLKE